MSIVLTWQMFAIVCPLCFFAGLVDAMAGGGGLISIPAYLAAGLPPHLAAGTNKLSAAIGTAASTARYMKSGHISLRAGLVAAALALPGSWLGTLLFNRMADKQILSMLSILLPIVAAVVLFRRGALTPALTLPVRWLLPVCALTGLVIGFYDGLVGPGTGTFLILIFTLIVGMDAVSASGSAKVVNLASNVASLVTQLFAGHVLFALGLPAAACGLVGNLLGAKLAIRGGAKVIRWMLLMVLALLFGTMVWTHLIKPLLG